MKKVLIVIGAPWTNMGSQALVRGLIHNIKAVFPKSYITMMVTYPSSNDEPYIPGIDKYMCRYSLRTGVWNYAKIANSFLSRLHGANKDEAYLNRYYELLMYDYIKTAKKSDIVFVFGADNYDQSYPNCVEYMDETNRFVEKIGKDKVVLYNCSVSEKDLVPKAIEDMKRFKYVTARDSISYQNLFRALPAQDVKFFADVAFSMEPEIVDLPNGWEEGNMIGINLSSLVGDGRYGISEAEVLRAYNEMVECIIQNTSLKICFIPHVKGGADLSVLRKLYGCVSDKTRAIIIDHENYNPAQKKYIISKCRFFVGARTHSTIAAYSSLVPTLVIGYSIKSIGIATDLLGTDEGNVIPVSKLKNPHALTEAFRQFYGREASIRNLLNASVPGYIAKAQGIQDVIKEIVK